MSSKLAFVIEDDYDGSMVFSKALEANGLKAEQIMEGKLALERLAKSVPALVVLDLHLPNVSGPDILKQIRADSRMKSTLVVVVTADSRMADMIKDDADLVLLKPTTFSQVRDLVGRLLAVRARNVPAKPAPAPSPVPGSTPSAPVKTPPDSTPSSP
jgi:CheY-like chemotaxis protein